MENLDLTDYVFKLCGKYKKWDNKKGFIDNHYVIRRFFWEANPKTEIKSVLFIITKQQSSG